MRHYIFEGEIDLENIKPLCTWISETKEPSTLYFNSHGGYIKYAVVIIDLLNKYSDLITIHMLERCSSSAFTICLEYKGKIIVSDVSESIIHVLTGEYSSRDLLDKKSIFNKMMKNQVLIGKEKYKQFLSPKEFKNLLKGKDIYLETNRLKQIFNNEKSNI